MVKKPFLFLVVCVVIGMRYVAASNDGNYYYEASQSTNVYIGSLNVGTGECHVVRQMNKAVIIDAGERQSSKRIKSVIKNIEDMLSGATLEAIFITHPHSDHYNLVSYILYSQNIGRSGDFKIYLGGFQRLYPDNFNNVFTAVNTARSNIRLLDGDYQFNDFCISARGVLPLEMNESVVIANASDINQFGSIIGLKFAGRRVAFLGDVDYIGFKIAMPIRACDFSIGKDAQSQHEMRDFLLNADMVAGLHHGLLNNAEDRIIASLLLEKQLRIFLVSADPESYQFPILSDILISLDRVTKLT